MRLCEALKKHEAEGYYPAHMPGHKGISGNSFLGDILKYDVTEIDGLDNLHDAQGVILESERFAADLYGVEETHFLVNGSTAGIISAISAVTEPGDKLLIARNCHRSVYNAAEINRLDVHYIYPRIIKDIGISLGITADPVEEGLRENPEIKAVVITSPTYEGISSDIAGIADAAHKYGAVLIVDAAHGAHFGFHKGFPESAASQGADIVINSVHKTLSAPTQTALLHINDVYGVRINKEAVRKQLAVFQTSSPSYLLMAGIDSCMSEIAEHGNELFKQYLNNLSRFEDRVEGLKHLDIIGRKRFKERYGIEGADPCKIIVCSNCFKTGMDAELSEGYNLSDSAGMSGRDLYDMLRLEHHIQPEMAADRYCLLIMTIMDTRQGFERIINALECIDEKIEENRTKRKCAERERREEGRRNSDENGINEILYGSRPEICMSVYEAVRAGCVYIRLTDAEGSIAADYVSLYPPGIPVLVPGERISGEMAAALEYAVDKGLYVKGITDDKEIKVHG